MDDFLRATGTKGQSSTDRGQAAREIRLPLRSDEKIGNILALSERQHRWKPVMLAARKYRDSSTRLRGLCMYGSSRRSPTRISRRGVPRSEFDVDRSFVREYALTYMSATGTNGQKIRSHSVNPWRNDISSRNAETKRNAQPNNANGNDA